MQELILNRQYTGSLLISMGIISLWVISLFFIGFSFPVYLAVITAVSLTIFITPKIGLPIIILATMWFERWFTLQPIVLGNINYKIYPLDIIFVVTFLAVIFHSAFGVGEKLYIKLRKTEGALILFILLCLGFLARQFITGDGDNSLAISAFKNYAFYAGLYFLVLLVTNSADDLIQIIKTILVGGAGIIFFQVIGIINGQGLWAEFAPVSTEGTRLLAFPHAFYLSVALIISLTLFAYYLRPQKSVLLTSWIWSFGILTSLMRHLWLALGTAFIFMFVALPKGAKKHIGKFFAKNFAVVVLIISVFILILVNFPFSQFTRSVEGVTGPVVSRARSLARSTLDSSAEWRVVAWQAARDSIVDNPVIGIGYGQELTIDFGTFQQIIAIRDLHNSFLVLVVQMGVLGGIVMFYFIWRIMVEFYYSFFKKGLVWPYELAIFSTFILYLVAAFWQPYFETNLTGIFFWILAGSFIASTRLD